MVSEIGINYRKQSLSKNASLGRFPTHAPKPGDRLPFIQYFDEKNGEGNILDKMRGKFFFLFVFSETVPKEVANLLEPLKDFFSIEIIPLAKQTKTLYDKFGISNKWMLLDSTRYVCCIQSRAV